MSRSHGPLVALLLVVCLLGSGCSEDGANDIEATSATQVSSPSSVEVDLPDGLVAVEQLMADSGGGDRPVLEWTAVEGADYYSVTVLGADGAPYWAWETSDTSVRVGYSDRPEESPGPRVAPGMSWSVSAFSTDGTPIAFSGHHPISP